MEICIPIYLNIIGLSLNMVGVMGALWANWPLRKVIDMLSEDRTADNITTKERIRYNWLTYGSITLFLIGLFLQLLSSILRLFL